MLKIVRACEPIQVKTIVTCVYAQPGIGRTTLGYSADGALLLDFDQAAHRAKNRGDTVLVSNWADVEKMEQGDFAGYRSVIVDTVGRALDHMTVTILAADIKNGNRAGGLSLQGYGALKTAFIGWLNKLRSYGLDVVLLAHMDEQKSGDDVKERLDIQGGSKNEVYKVADLMGRYYLENRKRVLNFNPSDVSFGKNPAQLDPFDVPHYSTMGGFLAGIIKTTKDAINKMSAEQLEVQGLLDAWKAKIGPAKNAAAFNALIDEGKKLDERIRENAKRIMGKAARDLGILLTKDGVFGDPKPADPAAPPASGEAKTENPKAASPSSGSSSASPPSTEAKAEPKTEEKGAKKTRGKKGEQESLPGAAAAAGERVPGQEG